ncbi:hypothetical protein PENSPDRAFT_686959 [Peniophora sp. CONT]|nr:hypothetical protein PENSPDRAFT_686959 [Peniophora sp. CONT]
MSNNPNNPPPEGSSFVYPTRTLLGNIQPSSSVESEGATSPPLATSPPTSPPLTRANTISFGESVESTPRPEAIAAAAAESSKPKRRKRRARSPNYRDFPAAGGSSGPRTFIAAPQPRSAEAAAAVDGEDEREEYDARYPPALSMLTQGAAAFRSPPAPPSSGVTSPRAERDPSPVHVTDPGIVLLPPRDVTSAAGSGDSARSRRSIRDGVDSGGSTTNVGSGSGGDSSAGQLVGVQPARPVSASADSGSSGQDGEALGSLVDGLGGDSSGTGTGYSSSSGEPYVTFRFEHSQDGDGHHVVVGREGKLLRCEDEPIRTPGAIQGFGILVAVQEDTVNETLVVRQVSENSTELLGLSPRYLFSLPCFTETLPDSQADTLWDNIQFLTDPDPNGEEDESPHVFLLSGWGMPGSARQDDPDRDQFNRRFWSCWCAAHRPAASADGSAATHKDLIILEFELEHDIYNPLYPAFSAGDATRSGSESPNTGSSSAGGSGTTLVSSSATRSDSRQSGVAAPPEPENTSISDDSGATLRSPGLGASPASHPPPTPEAGGLTTDGQGNILPSQSTDARPGPLTNPAESSGSGGSSGSNASLMSTNSSDTVHGLPGEENWVPSAEEILESTTNHAKAIPALERIRQMSRAPTAPGPTRRGGRRGRSGGGVGMMDVFAVMAQINEQLGSTADLEGFLRVVVGIIKDLTQFHRVLVYQFDEKWNGQTVAELVDWTMTHDLYRGLHFPAADIPAQARHLYTINKMRLLYDRDKITARLVCKSEEDLKVPLNMTHCYLRAMSPIHLKYLGNMGVRSSMSVSIMAFGQLWGLVACHSYGPHGMRVSFPVRQMLRLLSDSISRNIERLSYAQRLHTRKLFNTMTSDQHPTGYIVSNADDLLGLFDADFGVLVIGEGAKILGPNEHGQEVLVVAEYLRLKQFNMIQVSQAVTKDYPDLQLSTGLEVIAGLLYVPLSSGGKDFIALLRKGQPRHVHWAGKPYEDGEQGTKATLEPRKSFKVWNETVAGRCRAWTDEQLETAGVLALVYGKFIEVWRQKETALQTTKLTNLLLSNAGHEVRTPLNHIIGCLELALNGTLDLETRTNLSQSHAASKSLLFTINDLLDLTRLESGNETSFNEPFDLPGTIADATNLYKTEALRRGLKFELDTVGAPRIVVGDPSKIRTVVANLTANSLKYTERGAIAVTCKAFEEPPGLRNEKSVAVEIVVRDTGCGIPASKLESIFREFEQVESAQPKTNTGPGLGLGLAVVARIVEQLGGQLRVDSRVNEGSSFSFLIPFVLWDSENMSAGGGGSSASSLAGRSSSRGSNEVESIVDALSSQFGGAGPMIEAPSGPLTPGIVPIPGSRNPLRPVRIDEYDIDGQRQAKRRASKSSLRSSESRPSAGRRTPSDRKLRVLIVEDNDINRKILAKRLQLDGHIVVNTTNGQEGVDEVVRDQEFDCILMDVQMPILNGLEATERIRELEVSSLPRKNRASHILNGRIPIFAVSASLLERQRSELAATGLDGWILKPIDFKRLNLLLQGITDTEQRARDEYRVGGSWEAGGWFPRPEKKEPSRTDGDKVAPEDVDVGEPAVD